MILLSPHADDVCFSATQLACAARAGVLLTLFSSSSYTVGGPAPVDDEGIARVSAIRRGEDLAFASACGLTLESLGLDDAPIRGLDPFRQPTDREMSYVEAPLIDWLEGLPAVFAGGLLAVPAGIGGHVDHLTVRDVVIKHLEALMRRFTVCFYEDLHYASVPHKLQQGHAELLAALPRHAEVVRVQILLSEADITRKLGMIGLYASQLKALPTDLSAYCPAGPPSTPYEALWVLRRDGSTG